MHEEIGVVIVSRDGLWVRRVAGDCGKTSSSGGDGGSGSGSGTGVAGPTDSGGRCRGMSIGSAPPELKLTTLSPASRALPLSVLPLVTSPLSWSLSLSLSLARSWRDPRKESTPKEPASSAAAGARPAVDPCTGATAWSRAGATATRVAGAAGVAGAEGPPPAATAEPPERSAGEDEPEGACVVAPLPVPAPALGGTAAAVGAEGMATATGGDSWCWAAKGGGAEEVMMPEER